MNHLFRDKTWGCKFANFYRIFGCEFNDSQGMVQTQTSGFNEHLTHLLAKKSSLVWIILLSILYMPATAQLKDARQQIESLKQGTLYVVLPTYKKKVALLKEQLAEDLSNGERTRITNLLQETVDERDGFGKSLTTAFDQAYKFSNYIFIEDQALPKLLKNIISTDEQTIFFLDHGTTDNGARALILSDHLRQKLQRPLPYFARTGRASAIFEAIFGSNDLPWRDLTKVVMKWDQRLLKFYQK